MRRSIISILILLLASSCTSDLADTEQVNWCISKANMLAQLTPADKEYTETTFTDAWDILDENGLIHDGNRGRYSNVNLYFKGDEEKDLEARIKFREQYGDLDLDRRQGLFTFYHFLLLEENESALIHCKAWEDLSN